MTALSASQRTLRARTAAYARHSRCSGVEATAQARGGFLRRFELQVDPESQLDIAERTRRALLARKAHMGSLALKSARSRSQRAST